MYYVHQAGNLFRVMQLNNAGVFFVTTEKGAAEVVAQRLAGNEDNVLHTSDA